MYRRAFVRSLALGLAFARRAEAQPAGRVYRVGLLLSAGRDQAAHLVKGLEDGLREHGYAIGRNLAIESRFAEGGVERLPGLAAELVRLKVDVLVAPANTVVDAAKKATPTIPIVMVTAISPVESGYVASLARPGGSITGLTIDVGPEITAKRLQLLKELLPRALRIGVLWNPALPGRELHVKALVEAAPRLGVTLQFFEIRSAEDIGGAFAALARTRPDALNVMGDPLVFGRRQQIADLAARHRLPAMYPYRELVDAGGLVSYGVNLPDLFRRAGGYVDRILKGAKPADLPVEQPTRFEFVINLRAARALGVAVPAALLLRADQVIE